MDKAAPTEKLNTLFTSIFTSDQLIKMTLSDRRLKSIPYTRVTFRPITLSSGLKFQVEYTYEKKVVHENLNGQEAAFQAMSLMTGAFKQANIFLTDREIQVLASKPENPRIVEKTLEKPKIPSLSHNKQKRYIIPDGVPCDFLIRLGVMDQSGKVLQRHYNKFRQINRYLEIVEDVYPALTEDPQTDRPLRIIDFGCGKAYLTFAIYYYLKILRHRDVEIIGLDLKTDVIEFCNQVARDLGYDNLRFLMGDIVDYTNDHADMVVTLHACDTATDYALINAVTWNTKVILSVPCCQHELFRQIQNDLHQPMLKYGILKDRLTEYLTDGLRGLKLEACGYDVAMIEFTSLEHTARNIMIKAVKQSNPIDANRRSQSAATRSIAKKAARAQQQYEALRDFYHVSPTIDKLNPK